MIDREGKSMKTQATSNTREEWFARAIEELGKDLFARNGYKIPAVRVSVGFPAGSRGTGKVIGQCFASSSSKDKTPSIFIHPSLESATRVLDVLIHELVHAIDDCKSGHKKGFADIATALGLTGKMTATVASDELKAELDALVKKIGDYPHKALAYKGSGAGSRLLKVQCDDCGYTARITAKWLDEYDAPICPCRCDEFDGKVHLDEIDRMTIKG